MAACDTCQDEEAAFIVGVMESGEQQFLGPGCFARFGLEFAKAVLPAQEIAAQLGPMFVEPGAGGKEATRAERPRKRAPKPPPERKPEQEQEPGQSEASATAEDG